METSVLGSPGIKKMFFYKMSVCMCVCSGGEKHYLSVLHQTYQLNQWRCTRRVFFNQSLFWPKVSKNRFNCYKQTTLWTLITFKSEIESYLSLQHSLDSISLKIVVLILYVLTWLNCSFTFWHGLSYNVLYLKKIFWGCNRSICFVVPGPRHFITKCMRVCVVVCMQR